MKILLVAATRLEVEPILSHFKQLDDSRFTHAHHEIQLLVSGVGMLATTYQLTKTLLNQPFDLLLNVGICGAFDRSIELGEVVWVKDDVAIEEGAEDGEHWLSLEDIKLRGSNEFPYQQGRIKSELPPKLIRQLPKRSVSAVSVNRVLGNDRSIKKMIDFAAPDVESMEGAAVYYVAESEGIKAVQLRSVSNYVENRDRSAWKMDEALANLAHATVKFIENV